MILGGFALVLFVPALQAQTAPAPEPVLSIEAKIYRADGKVSGSVGKEDSAAFQTYLWTSTDLCRVGTSAALDQVDRDRAPMIWRVSGRLLPPSSGAAVAQVEWQRVDQAEPRAAKGSAQIALGRAEPVVLEKQAASTSSLCGVEVQLRASLDLRARTPVGPGAGSRGPALLDTELWLVHTRPDGAEDGRHVTIQPDASGAPYAFPALTIPTTKGTMKVEVSGVIRPTVRGGSVTGLSVRLDRRLTSDGTPPIDTRGDSSKEISLPNPNDVIAFEMPALPSPAGELLSGHQFSLRLRAKAIKIGPD
jgi:hypothetical protein